MEEVEMFSLLKNKVFRQKPSVSGIPHDALIGARLDMPYERHVIEEIKLDDSEGWLIRLSGGFVEGVREIGYPSLKAMRDGRKQLVLQMKRATESNLSGRYLRNHGEDIYRPMTRARLEATAKILDSMTEQEIHAAARYLYHGDAVAQEIRDMADQVADSDVFYRCLAIKRGSESIC
jgi:hypothetical protein